MAESISVLYRIEVINPSRPVGLPRAGRVRGDVLGRLAQRRQHLLRTRQKPIRQIRGQIRGESLDSFADRDSWGDVTCIRAYSEGFSQCCCGFRGGSSVADLRI